MQSSKEWCQKVGKVFDTRPRVATANTFWLERNQAYKQFAQAAERPGGHICLDGPTGVGKTSLVHTYIERESLRHIPIMITHSMQWKDVCRKIIGIRKNDESSGGAEFEGGIHNGLPTAKFKLSVSEKSKPYDNLKYSEDLSDRWSEEDVAKYLSRHNAALILDDLERSSSELLLRISDLCKALTQQYVSENAKLIMVGSGDIYQRIHKSNPALDERVSQISLGAFNGSNDSRLVIVRGLEKLRLRHPWNSRFKVEFDQRDDCREAIWQAADGLPKSLNRLGYEIAIRGFSRSAVSVTDIIDCCQQIIDKNIENYLQEFPDILTIISDDEKVAQIVKCLYETGIARIHNWNGVKEKIKQLYPREFNNDENLYELSLSKLVDLGFLFRTGPSGALLFVKHPAAAHTLGVVARDPNRIDKINTLRRRFSKEPVQLDLPGIFVHPANNKLVDANDPSDDA